MPRVVHFEIHATDPERIGRFYHELLGWEIAVWDGPVDYRLVSTGPRDQPGIDGGITARRGEAAGEGQPVNAFVCTVEVESLDATMARVAPLGGSLVVPKSPIPGVGWLAYATDPDGNIFGLMQNDPGAA